MVKEKKMKTLSIQTEKFRDIIRQIEDEEAGFTVQNKTFWIGNLYGETDLIKCKKYCFEDYGWYAVVEPHHRMQEYIQVVYQCSNCDHVYIKTYGVREVKRYREEERAFVQTLTSVMMERMRKEKDYEKRKRVDILEIKEEEKIPEKAKKHIDEHKRKGDKKRGRGILVKVITKHN
ncbi:MAG: hypothetical protein ACFFD1_14375 [Candidatus Thorarchaeota archaeon]